MRNPVLCCLLGGCLVACAPFARTDGRDLDNSKLSLRFGEQYKLTVRLADRVLEYAPVRLVGAQQRWGNSYAGFADNIFVEVSAGDAQGAYLATTNYNDFNLVIFDEAGLRLETEVLNGRANKDGVLCDFMFVSLGNPPYRGAYYRFLDWNTGVRNTFVDGACRLERL